MRQNNVKIARVRSLTSRQIIVKRLTKIARQDEDMARSRDDVGLHRLSTPPEVPIRY